MTPGDSIELQLKGDYGVQIGKARDVTIHQGPGAGVGS